MKVMKMTTFIFFAVFIVSLVSCDRTQQVLKPINPPMSGLSGEFNIGVVLPQTGPLGPGESGPGALVMENSFKMALEEINASQLLGDATLKFIIEDDMSTVEGAVTAFNKLIHQDNVPVILGVWTSQVARTVFPIAQENGVVAFSPVVIAPDLTKGRDFVFRASHTTEALIPEGVRLTQQKLGYQKVATIVDTMDAASENGDAVFRQALADNSVEVLTTQTLSTGDTDFTEQLTAIKALEPDAIFVSAQQIEVIHILKQAREIGIPAETPIVSLILSIHEIEKLGDAAEGAITLTDWVSTADTSGNKEFVENYTAKYGIAPSVWAAQPYAAVYVLAEALKNAQSTDSVSIAAALAAVQVDTILGNFSFDANGDPIYDPVVLIVKDRKFEVFQ